MRSLNGKSEQNRLYDDLYFELCVLQACAWGVHHIGLKRYDSLNENMVCALLRECERVMEMFDNLGKDKDTDE